MQINFILQFALAMMVWLTTNIFAYYFTDEWGVAYKTKWLDFKPFNCRRCFTFWFHFFVSTFLYFATAERFKTFLFTSFAFMILTAIALYVDEKNNTIKIDEKL